MTNNRFFQRVAALMLGGSLLLNSSVGFATVTSGKVPIKPCVLVDQARINVSQLISVPVSTSLRETLSKIPLGVIGQPLGEMTLDGAEIAKRLGSLSSLFDFPERVQIRRRGDLLPGTDIAARIEQAVKEAAPAGSASQIRIDFSRLPRNIVLPGALTSWKVAAMSGNPLGMVLFSFEAECEGGKAKQIVQVEVWREITAAKVKRLIKKGACICAEDLVREIVRVRTASAQVPASFEEVIGRPCATYKSPGSLIRVADLAAIGAGMTPERELAAAVALSKSRPHRIQKAPARVSESADADADSDAGMDVAPITTGPAIPGETGEIREIAETGEAGDTSEVRDTREIGEARKGALTEGNIGSLDAERLTNRGTPDEKTSGPIYAGRPGLVSALASARGATTAKLPSRFSNGASDSQWIVKPGENVDFTVKSGGLNLTVPARALEGGVVGTPIRLVNLQNQRPIRGRVVAKGQVEFYEQ
ncbi:MAG: flagella basal body P-ring formation protein FlgA [Candidatus Ozemobacteraceae bacterium]